MDIKELQAAAKKVKLADIKVAPSGNAHLSFGIVNSKRNGKRVTLSKSLVSAIEVAESAAMIPIPDKGVLMIGKALPYEAASNVNLKDDGGGKIAYNSGMVALLTQTFGLNFTDHVSVSYSDIEVNTLDNGTPVAIVKIYNKYPTKNEPQTQEQ